MLPRTIKALIQTLKKRRIAFVMFGMEALNLYARGPDESFSTLDTDFLIGGSTTVGDVVDALTPVRWPEAVSVVYQRSGSDPVEVYDGVRWKRRRLPAARQGTLSVCTPTGPYHVDLAFGDCGIPFEALWKKSNRATFLGSVIRVARKEDILESKRKAGRDKDLVILSRFMKRKRPRSKRFRV